MGFSFCREFCIAGQAVFAAVRRSDKPCSYSSLSFTNFVYDAKL